ncbi:MAG: hypothetical protein GF310_05040, partial [candidate division Zixibacteria bacterium]|nr:hypothetical protein [candidate division Zixibacteria bacterium]
MHCREAKKKIAHYKGLIPENERDLLKHIDSCESCRLYVRAEQLIEKDLAVAADEKTDEPLPYDILIKRVEAQAKIQDEMYREKNIMSKIYDNVSRRPALSAGLGIVVVLLIVMTLVPFNAQRITGYEVAIGGVHGDFAQDKEKIDELLKTLEIDGVQFEIEDCDDNCIIRFKNLETEREAVLIVTAFKKLNQHDSDSIMPILEKQTVSLANEVKHLLEYQDSHVAESEEIHLLVIKKLENNPDFAEAYATTYSPLVERIGQSDFLDSLLEGDDYDIKLDFLDENSPVKSLIYPITQDPKTYNIWNPMPNIKLITRDGRELVIKSEDFDEGLEKYDLDGDEIEEYAERGISMSLVPTDRRDSLSNNTSDSGERSQKALPKAFELNQNFPNPFNATTQITYKLTRGSNVSL